MKKKMKQPLFIVLWAFLFVVTEISFAQKASEVSLSVKEELDIKVTMRDGVRLSTNIYRPEKDGKFPALLIRTPYGNGGEGNRDGHYFAQRGYVVVIQDTRGIYESEGIFRCFSI